MIAGNVIGAILALGVVIGGAMVFDRTPPSYVSDATVLTPEVKPGEDLRILVKVNRWRFCPAVYSSIFVDGAGQVTPLQATVNTRIGILGTTYITVTQQIPAGATPGYSQLTRLGSYTCNSLQNALNWPIALQLFRVQFTVTPPNDTVK